jgi:hypothetical protein
MPIIGQPNVTACDDGQKSEKPFAAGAIRKELTSTLGAS